MGDYLNVFIFMFKNLMAHIFFKTSFNEIVFGDYYLLYAYKIESVQCKSGLVFILYFTFMFFAFIIDFHEF